MSKSKKNNLEQLREIIRNTEDNLQEAEISKEFADLEQKVEMSQKNERRKQAIEVLKEEMKEEITDLKKH